MTKLEELQGRNDKLWGEKDTAFHALVKAGGEYRNAQDSMDRDRTDKLQAELNKAHCHHSNVDDEFGRAYAELNKYKKENDRD